MALSAEKAPAIVGAKPKKARAPKDSNPKKPRSHPSYFEMIGNAIGILKERSGSSQYAITKFIEEKQKNNLPSNFKKMLLYHLKKLVATGKLVKIKNSFKIPVAQALPAKKPAPPAAAKPKQKPVASGKPKAVAAKRKAAAPIEPKPKAVAAKRKAAAPIEPKPKAVAAKRKAAAPVEPKVAKVAKKATSVKPVKAKKPKSVKSPAKKAAASKKVKKVTK